MRIKPVARPLRREVRAPVRARARHDAARSEHDRRVRGALQQRQAIAREDERRGDVDVHRAHPLRHVVMLDRRALAEHAGVVQQRVEPAELLLQRRGELLVLVGPGLLEIERHDRRPRLLRCDDGVVDRFELAHVATVQEHGRAVRSSGLRDGFADAVARAGDENNSCQSARRPRACRCGIDPCRHCTRSVLQQTRQPMQHVQHELRVLRRLGSFMPMRPTTWSPSTASAR